MEICVSIDDTDISLLACNPGCIGFLWQYCYGIWRNKVYESYPQISITQKGFDKDLSLNELILLQMENQMGPNWMKSLGKCLIKSQWLGVPALCVE